MPYQRPNSFNETEAEILMTALLGTPPALPLLQELVNFRSLCKLAEEREGMTPEEVALALQQIFIAHLRDLEALLGEGDSETTAIRQAEIDQEVGLIRLTLVPHLRRVWNRELEIREDREAARAKVGELLARLKPPAEPKRICPSHRSRGAKKLCQNAA